MLGLLQLDRWQFNPGHIRVPGQGPSAGTAPGFATTMLSDAEIEHRLDERIKAKREKDFKQADEIRAELAAQGIIIEDKPDGTTRWKR